MDIINYEKAKKIQEEIASAETGEDTIVPKIESLFSCTTTGLEEESKNDLINIVIYEIEQHYINYKTQLEDEFKKI